MPVPRPERAAEIPTDPEYRTGLTLFVVTLVAYCIQALTYVPLRLIPVAVPTMALVCALELRFGLRDAWRERRIGPWIGLAALALAAYLPLNVFGGNWIGVTGYLVGSLLMALPYSASVPLVALAASIAGVVSGTHTHSVGNGFDTAFNSLVTGILVYGLMRLIRLVRELAKRLAERADGWDGERGAAELVAAELRELAALAAKTREELGTVLGEANSGPQLSFQPELDSAVAVLKVAGIETEVDTAPLSLSPQTSAALGVVLREAVTNVLRHSAAAYCRIALVSGVRLIVENDGVELAGSVTPRGAGLGNPARRRALIPLSSKC
jgi:hypothetical protein